MFDKQTQSLLQKLGRTFTNGDVASIEDFYLYETGNAAEFRGQKHPHRRTIMVQGTSYDGGDRDTPATTDVYDIQEFNTLWDAIKFILLELYERELNLMHESEYEL